MDKKKIVKKILSELKSKGFLKESPEGEANSFTTEIQNSVQELSSIKDYLSQLSGTIVDIEEQKLLELIGNKVDYVSTSLNQIISKHTSEVQNIPTSPSLEGQMEESDDPSVNMSVDSVVNKPDDLKKLSDKDIEVNLVDDQGKSLVEKKQLKKANKI